MNLTTINKFFITVFLIFLTTAGYAQIAKPAVVLNLNGAIGPAAAEYVSQGFNTAIQDSAEVIILQMDTPGGLDSAMRSIIKAILASPIPVIGFVAPSGARAASAGTYILYASHLAAMAPGTNLGAATPVQLSATGSSKSDKKPSATESKAKNDAIAYIKSLAQLRGRNVQWAEKSVSMADSIPAQEALKLNVINLIAKNVPALLKAIDGIKVNLNGDVKVLNTQNIPIITINPNWRSRFLAIITNPSIAYILILIGIYGLFFEFSQPGFIAPGVIGGIALIIGLYGLNLLPVNYAGLALMILGLALMIAEAFLPSFGIIGLGGTIAFILGSVFLIKSHAGFIQISWVIIVAMAILNALFFLGIVGIAIRSRRRRIVSGKEYLIGMEGYALESFSEEGWVHINGERWHAQTSHPISKDQKVRVKAVDGLKLILE